MKPLVYLFFIFIANNSLSAQVSEDSTKVDLHVNILPGEKYLYSTSTKQNITQEIMGEQIEINQEFTTDYHYLVESIEGDLIKIKATYKRILLAIDSPQDQLQFSSDEAEADSRLSTLNSLIGKSFYIFMNTDGKVQKITGFDELSKNLKLGDSLKLLLSESSIIHAVNMDIYSRNPVAMGESWNKENLINLKNLELKNNLTYTLEGSSEDLAWLNVSGTISPNSENDSFDIKLTGTQTGTYEADLKSGMLSSGNVKMEVEATIKSLDLEIPLKITSETNISSRKL